MFQNYFKIAWRTITRQKLYAGIKIGGFSLGIATCLLIALFVSNELRYDRHYANADRIYRIFAETRFRGEMNKNIYFPLPMAQALREDYPEISLSGHVNIGETFGSRGNELRRLEQTQSLHEEGFIFADQGLIDVLELPFVTGSAKDALTRPNSIVITSRKAAKFFPGEDPIGKVLVLNNDLKKQYVVSGVIRDFPETTHLKADFLISLEGHEFWQGENTNWRASNYQDYIVVNPGTHIPDLEAKLKSLTDKYFLPSAGAQADKAELSWIKSMRFRLQPVTQIYLNQEKINDGLPHGEPRYVGLFGAIAVFILVIACINFINLSTAKSANRAREVGLRKAIGSQRGSLVRQFLTESLLFSFVSFAIGLVLARLALPYFNTLLGKSLDFSWFGGWMIPVILVAAMVIGILAGIYPAFYLSSFRPAEVLKGNISLGARSSSMRSALVVFQFTVSIILIIGTMIIRQQMDFVLNKDVGFDKEQVLILQDTRTLGEKVISLKTELMRLSEVKHASITSFLPISGMIRNGNPFWQEGKKTDDSGIGAQQWPVDHDYVTTMGIRILAGRNFSSSIASDSGAMIINARMARMMNLNDPIGATIVNPWNGKWHVIGVMEDFNFESLRQNIEPLNLILGRSPDVVMVKIAGRDTKAAVREVSRVWKEFSPNQSVRYTFLDQAYAHTYEDVQRTGSIFADFTALAIVVACLGLFGFSAFMVEQRSKEISIRIVLGATAQNILRLLTQNLFILVLVSMIIATPVAWLMMRKWLEDYAYRIDVSWTTFLIAGAAAIAVAGITVSYHVVRSAFVNPVTGLRSE